MDETPKSPSAPQTEAPKTEAMTPEALALLPRIQEAVDEIRPNLQADGGDIELLGVTPELKARVRLVGACSGCPSAAITLSFGVERYLCERVPECKGIEVEGGTPTPPPFGYPF